MWVEYYDFLEYFLSVGFFFGLQRGEKEGEMKKRKQKIYWFQHGAVYE